MNTPVPSLDENTNADDSKIPARKKEKILQPINDLKNTSLTISGASEDLLAELRAKTARLAEQVAGKDDPVKTALRIDDDSVTKEDIIEALKDDPSKQIQKAVNLDAPNDEDQDTSSPAVELVRSKLAKLYKKEPDAAEEAIESYQAGKGRSKHQQFMYDLTTSGKSLADIQSEWHAYYSSLPNDGKHEVWSEFYSAQNQPADTHKKSETTPNNQQANPSDNLQPATANNNPRDTRTVGDIKSQLLDKVSAGGKLTAVHHVKSLLFGVGLAALVGLIITFTFFNEVFVAPFISPSRSVSATPIIGNSTTNEVGPESKIIIPKINLEVPIVFGMDTIEEKAIQTALEEGVVHYATTPNPGQKGNVSIVGHSSNNILNAGKYKFAFVLLKRLESEDTFFVNKDGIRYTYKVYKKDIVGPDDISVLDTQEKANTITLITCDPPGTSINRLIIVAEQISPDPTNNKVSTAIESNTEASELPSNAPSLWSRLWPF